MANRIRTKRGLAAWLSMWAAVFATMTLSAGCSDGSNRRSDGPIVIVEDTGELDAGEDVDPTQTDPQCDPGLSYCAEQCVDTLANPLNCGECGTECSGGEFCNEGSCVEQTVACPEFECTGFSYCELSSGACLPGCSDDDQCNGGMECDLDSRECVCPEETHVCGGVCVSDFDVLTCGDRCQPCPNSGGVASCEAGVCQVQCEDGERMCGGSCVSCPANATDTICDGNQCVANSCAPGQAVCGGECVTCPSIEGATVGCEGNQCIFLDCAFGYHRCDDACVADDSVLHCGQSCQACPTDPNGSATCDGTSCALICEAGTHACASGCCPWEVETIATVTFDTQIFAMTSDSQGRPWIAARTSGDDELISLRWTGAAWEADSVAFEVSGQPVIAAGSNGDVSVAYMANTATFGTTYRLFVAEWTGSGWSSQQVDLSDFDTTDTFAFALDSAGDPHLAYALSDSNGRHLNYIVRSGGTWSSERIYADIGYLGGRTSLMIDDANNAHVAFHRSDSPSVYYGTNASGSWSSERVDRGGYSTRLAFNEQAQPVLLYSDISPGALRSAFREANGSWSTSTVEQVSTSGRSLAFDAHGEGHLSYIRASDEALRYGTWGSTGWEVQTISVAGPIDGGTAMSLDADGNPMIVFQQGNALKWVR